MMITYTSFYDFRLVRTSWPISKKTSFEVPDNDLKHVLVLIKFAKEKVAHRSNR